MNYKCRQRAELLEDAKKALEKLIADVDAYLHGCPPRIQRIIKYKYIERKTWEDTAELLKAKSGDSIRMEIVRYIKLRED